MRAAALFLVLGVAVLVAPELPAGSASTGADPAVSAQMQEPWFWQATVVEQPPGPATAVYTTGFGVFADAASAVAGRSGAVSVIDIHPGDSIGELSPDGRVVARAPGVLDLTSGELRPYEFMEPVAWSPDGRLVAGYVDDHSVVVHDVTTGTRHRLTAEHEPYRVDAAFSPDSAAVAVEVTEGGRRQLAVLPVDGGPRRWQIPLAEHEHLAGAGSWSRDGRLALFTMQGCYEVCYEGQSPGDVGWSVRYLDAATGAPRGGSTAAAPGHATALGWRSGTELAVGVTIPASDGDADDRRHQIRILGSGPDEVVLDQKEGLLSIQPARDLVEAGRFGGPAVRPAPWSMRREVSVPIGLVLLLVAGVSWARGRRRRRSEGGSPVPSPS